MPEYDTFAQRAQANVVPSFFGAQTQSVDQVIRLDSSHFVTPLSTSDPAGLIVPVDIPVGLDSTDALLNPAHLVCTATYWMDLVELQTDNNHCWVRILR